MRLSSCGGSLLPAIASLAFLHAAPVVAAEPTPAAAPQVRAALVPRASDSPFGARAVLVPVATSAEYGISAHLSSVAPSAACDAPDLIFADSFETLIPRSMDPSP
jgi:hypothetical protein